MRGVYKQGNLWKATYSNRENVGSIVKYFKHEKDAQKYRKQLENKFGVPSLGKTKDYSGFENDFWKIIGGTDERNGSRSQKVVTLNKSTGKYELKSALDITVRNQKGRRKPGKKGCWFDSKINKWTSGITIQGKHYYLGSFKTRNEATEKYLDSLNQWQNYGIIPKPIPIKSFSGVKGVRFDKRKNVKKWYAIIGVNGKRKHLGFYLTKQEAIAARKEAERKYLNKETN